jgi:hypothetical protein
MGLAFAMTAMTTARVGGGSLSWSALALLVAGFVALPLLAYSHSLYPETFMATAVSAVTLLTFLYLQSSDRKKRTGLALAAISVSALTIALHPKYFLVLLAVTAFLVVVEVMDASKDRNGARLSSVMWYSLTAAGWTLIFSAIHSVMWGHFNPFGWWLQVRGSLGVELGRVAVQGVDLLFGRELGLFFLVPLTILWVGFLVFALRTPDRNLKRLALLTLILAVFMAGPAAYSADWHAGDSPAARYLSPLVPLMLLGGVSVATRQASDLSRRVFAWVAAALGIMLGLAYTARPLVFRHGRGGILAFFESPEKIAWLDRWLWYADAPNAWPGLLVWLGAIGVVIALFGRAKDGAVSGQTRASGEPVLVARLEDDDPIEAHSN